MPKLLTDKVSRVNCGPCSDNDLSFKLYAITKDNLAVNYKKCFGWISDSL